jgi:hypothetical protein
VRLARPGSECFPKGESLRIGSRETAIGGYQFAGAPRGARDHDGASGDRRSGVSENAACHPAFGRSDPSGKYSETGEVCRHKPEQAHQLYFSAVEHESGDDGVLGGFEQEWDAGSHGTNDFADEWRKFGRPGGCSDEAGADRAGRGRGCRVGGPGASGRYDHVRWPRCGNVAQNEHILFSQPERARSRISRGAADADGFATDMVGRPERKLDGGAVKKSKHR